MKLTPELDKYFHSRLPIDPNETILSVHKRHFAVFFIPILLALSFIIALFSIAYLMLADSSSGAIVSSDYRDVTIIGIGIFSFIVLLFTYIPVWVKSQDRLILTDEAVMQLIQTSLFSNKVSQLSLQHVADVTVKAGFWGNLLGFGSITIETPGEQANYTFSYLPDAHTVAREISMAHEDFIAALQTGRMHTSHRNLEPEQQDIHIDPKQYRQFLEFQKMQQQANQNSPTFTPPKPPEN